MHLIREYAWMTACLEDDMRKLAGINKSDHEPFVLRNGFRSLLSKAVYNLYN